MKKSVDNYVDNAVKKCVVLPEAAANVDINALFKHFFVSFPRNFAEKRYKLINFAPKLESVDKVFTCLIIKKKELTVDVNKWISQQNN